MILDFDAIGFCNHIYQYGLELDPSKIKIDGKWHNCRMIDNVPGKKAGCYAIFLNTGIAVFKSWRDSVVHKYYPEKVSLSNFDFKKVMKEQKQKQYDTWYQASRHSFAKYYSTVDVDLESKYLFNKHINIDKHTLDVKVDIQGNLVIPYYNFKGYIATLQTILPNGTKMFEEDGRTSGCFHRIGFNMINQDYAEEIYLGEGFATMASVYKAVNKPCVVSGFVSNLLPVLDNLTKLYPQARFIICADNDIYLREMPVGSRRMVWSNPGVEAAINCQLQHQCAVVIPDFKNLDNDVELTDFNDMDVRFGIDEVRKQITTQLMHKDKTVFVKNTWTAAEYKHIPYSSKLISFKNYFEHFGQANIDDYLDKSILLTINNLQLDYKIYDETSVTSLFVNFSLAFTEQITDEETIIKYHPEHFAIFEEKLEKIKLSQLIELDDKLNQCYSEIKNLKQENANLNLFKECEYG